MYNVHMYTFEIPYLTDIYSTTFALSCFRGNLETDLDLVIVFFCIGGYRKVKWGTKSVILQGSSYNEILVENSCTQESAEFLK
jgi:hypothetical protein